MILSVILLSGITFLEFIFLEKLDLKEYGKDKVWALNIGAFLLTGLAYIFIGSIGTSALKPFLVGAVLFTSSSLFGASMFLSNREEGPWTIMVGRFAFLTVWTIFILLMVRNKTNVKKNDMKSQWSVLAAIISHTVCFIVFFEVYQTQIGEEGVINGERTTDTVLTYMFITLIHCGLSIMLMHLISERVLILDKNDKLELMKSILWLNGFILVLNVVTPIFYLLAFV